MATTEIKRIRIRGIGISKEYTRVSMRVWCCNANGKRIPIHEELMLQDCKDSRKAGCIISYTKHVK